MHPFQATKDKGSFFLTQNKMELLIVKQRAYISFLEQETGRLESEKEEILHYYNEAKKNLGNKISEVAMLREKMKEQLVTINKYKKKSNKKQI